MHEFVLHHGLCPGDSAGPTDLPHFEKIVESGHCHCIVTAFDVHFMYSVFLASRALHCRMLFEASPYYAKV